MDGGGHGGASLAAAEADSPRSDALVRLFVEACLRVSEAVGADIEDLGFDKGLRVLTVIGKGGAEVKIGAAAVRRLARDASVKERLCRGSCSAVVS